MVFRLQADSNHATGTRVLFRRKDGWPSEYERILFSSLIQGVARCLQEGGVFVLAFPNPRALRTHLFQFWKDPQHVRFYDSDLIEGVLKHAGFEIMHNSDNDRARVLKEAFLPQKSEWLCWSPLGDRGKIRMKARVSYWIRSLLGIVDLAKDVESVYNLLDSHEEYLLRPYDMEVRLVSKKPLDQSSGTSAIS